MLDTRVYRAAFIPFVFAVLVAAFGLAERPRAIGTTLAPDAFDGRRAFATLTELARTFPRTRPGSPGDDALAERVQAQLRLSGFDVRTETTRAETVDGEQALRTVVAERAGLNDRRIVVVANRDTAVEDDRPRLSGTAGLLELARLYRGRPTRRTLTFVSTSGATGGMAGIRALAGDLGGPVDAVIVVGDLAGREQRAPFVIPWADRGGLAPLRLRRTVEEALRLETDADPGAPRALLQVARLAVPLTRTAQGPLGAAGLAAVTLQVSGERGPDAVGERSVSRARLQSFGRGLLRSISALDNGPDVPAGPREYLVFQRRVLPRWTVQVIGGLLLLPALIAAVDGLARVRRRRQRVAVWVRWLVAATLPFVLTVGFAKLLGLLGLVPPLAGGIQIAALPPEAPAMAVLGLAFAVGLVLRTPLARVLGAPGRPLPEEVPGAAAAVAVASVVLAVAIWAFNPYTGLLLAPAVHLWLLAAAPEIRLPRPVLALLVPLGLVPFALVAAAYAGAFGLGPVEALWQAVLLLVGGTVGPLGALAWSAVLACGLGALLVALRKSREAPTGPDREGPVSIRGPLSYAGPGSLGGTDSAIGR